MTHTKINSEKTSKGIVHKECKNICGQYVYVYIYIYIYIFYICLIEDLFFQEKTIKLCTNTSQSYSVHTFILISLSLDIVLNESKLSQMLTFLTYFFGGLSVLFIILSLSSVNLPLFVIIRAR